MQLFMIRFRLFNQSTQHTHEPKRYLDVFDIFGATNCEILGCLSKISSSSPDTLSGPRFQQIYETNFSQITCLLLEYRPVMRFI